MSGNNYGYYYPQSSQNFSGDPTQAWSEWTLEQQQYNDSHNRATPQHHANVLSHPSMHSTSYVNHPVNHRSQSFYNPNNRSYQQRRFNNGNQTFSQNSWQQRNNFKRSRPQDTSSDSIEPKSKPTKKKKKPLSQNVPSKKDWTLEEAEMALAVEKEYNKRYKNHSLIIKFPDLELNRDIVSKFHPSIENVHFQQPSTPRFCFVTLQETADADGVINALNKIKFGEGYLTAEYKKDREEDQNIGPEDIDPCTLYVGNLAQEITKEDMVKTYPKGRRIDIGYAKKMKYTRYAFVSFKNVIDSIEAFKQTHSTQMYSKSLIVRFRRLHGTVGMPGESKSQSPVKSKSDAGNSLEQVNMGVSNDESNNASEVPLNDNSNLNVTSANKTSPVQSQLDLSVVKQEINSSDDEDRGEEKIEVSSNFMPGSINIAFDQHRPMIKPEIKTEVEEVDLSTNNYLGPQQANGSRAHVKQEVESAGNVVVKNERVEEDSSDDDCDTDLGDVNFSSLLDQLVDHSKQIASLRKSVP